MERRVVITGMGWVTPLGQDIEDVWRRMLAGECGVEQTSLFDAQTFPSSFSAQVESFSLSDLLDQSDPDHTGASRSTQFALGAAIKAWKHSGLSDYVALDPSRVGIYLGGGEGPLDFEPFAKAALAGCLSETNEREPLNTVRWAHAANAALDGVREMEQEQHMAAAHLAVHFKARGPGFNILTACAASTQALGEARHIIRYGDADVVISGGAHSMIHPLGVTGFNRLTALSTRSDSYRTASRPFDRTRDGFVIGEGAGILILEELQHALNRGAPILAEIVGFGSTADAFRITDIHDAGRGGIAAMRGALASAGLQPSDIQYISAHGTGTEENDKIETLAIRAVFGQCARKVAVTSIKSMIGHLIAAAGAVELITCVLAIRDGVVPPTINYSAPDPNCDLDYVPNESRKVPVRAALSNSFGFGGQNDSLVVRAFKA